MDPTSIPKDYLGGYAGAGNQLRVRAFLVGERLDTRRLEKQEVLGTMPLTARVDEGGIAVLFRYGAVVLFNVADAAEEALFQRLKPFVVDPFGVPDVEETQVDIGTGGEDSVDPEGRVFFKSVTVERIQIVADAIAKSLVLSHYEASIAFAFDRIEPLATRLGRSGRVGREGKELLRQVGAILAIQHKIVGRAGTGDTPDLLWDHPDLGRLYARIAEGYEIREREQALDRKLEVISRTVETLIDLGQQRSSLRLEWYVIVLIIVEIVISIYSLAH